MKIAWIGTGVMGKRMVKRLLDADHEVMVFNRTMTKLDDLEHKNLFKCNSIPQCIHNADVIFTMLGYPSDVKEVYLNKTNGIIENARIEQICVDMTTSDPELAKLLSQNEKKITILDAPVTGAEKGAENGNLSIMVGGDIKAFEKIKPILEILGNKINYFGDSGNGQHAKLANQIMVAINTAMTAELITYCESNGINSKQALDIILKTTGWSWQNDVNGKKMIAKDFLPGFYIKHFLKDINLVKQNTQKHLYGTNQVYKIYDEFVAKDPTNYDYGTQAIYKFYKKIKGDY